MEKMVENIRKNFIYCNSVAAHPCQSQGERLEHQCFKHAERNYLYEYRKIMRRKKPRGV